MLLADNKVFGPQVQHFVEYCLELPFRRVDFFFEGRKFPFDKVVFAFANSICAWRDNEM